MVLLDRLKASTERLAYARAAIEHGWSRNVLNIHIETRLLERTGKAVTNFEQRLPAPQSDLAIESLKDPYRFDFLGLGEEAQEREIENALVQHVTDFLLELGRASPSLADRCCWTWAAKSSSSTCCSITSAALLRGDRTEGGKFKPEHLGQLGFYLTAVDRQVKHAQDNPSIGLLLCKSKNKVVAEYALGDKSQPMGIAEYKLVESLPQELQTGLPTIEQIERELGKPI